MDIIIACETHLTPDIRNSEPFSSDFTVYRKDRNHCGGGVLIVVKNHLASLPHPDLDENCEIVWAEVSFEGESLLICSFYRPPSADVASLSELDISLKKAVHLAGNRHILVGGDFNLPSINWNTLSVVTPARDSGLCHYFLDIVQDYYLEQLVLEPTRRGATTSNTLDLLLTSKPGLINDVQIIPGLSDHDHVVATVNKCVQVPSQKSRRIYNFGKGNFEGFSHDMAQLAEHFQLSFHLRSVNENWSLCKNAILSFADNYFPVKAARPAKPNPWFNRSLRRLTRKKQRLFYRDKTTNSPHAWTAYRKHRKVTSRAINQARNNYVSNLLDENLFTCPKKFWSYIKSKRQDFFGIPSLKVNNQIIVDNKEKANVLNDYFHSVFTTDDDSPPSIPSCNIASVDKPQISIKGVADLINQLKSNKATGPDGISAQLLKLAPVDSAIILKCIFQQSLDSGIVPIDWKHALVTPIHKKDSKSSIGNYRPISLTCISCKLLEHIRCIFFVVIL